jgi:cullin-associated NEDD8-dissociated protein 1
LTDSDLDGHPDLFQLVLGHFDSESESIRTAAASAAGNLAVGSPGVFLPELLKQIEAGSGSGNRLFLLHALKEVSSPRCYARLP